MIIKYGFFRDKNDLVREMYCYEVPTDELRDALQKIMYNDILKNNSKNAILLQNKETVKATIKYFTEELDILDDLASCYAEQVEDAFYDEAYKEYKNIS